MLREAGETLPLEGFEITATAAGCLVELVPHTFEEHHLNFYRVPARRMVVIASGAEPFDFVSSACSIVRRGSLYGKADVELSEDPADYLHDLNRLPVRPEFLAEFEDRIPQYCNRCEVKHSRDSEECVFCGGYLSNRRPG